MFRPPAREMCLNTVEDVYQTCKYPLPLLSTSIVYLTCDEQMRNPDLLRAKSSPSGALKVQFWRQLQMRHCHHQRQSLLLQSHNLATCTTRWKDDDKMR